MQDIMSIKAEPRTEIGKKMAGQLRKQGKIPAIIYGEKKESIPISIAAGDLKTILKSEKGENTVLRIQRADIEVDAMLKEVQYDYLGDRVIHVDFLRIDLQKPITARIPVVTQGEPIGVKLEDGLFDFITREIQVKCLATKIPKEIVLQVGDMHTGHSVKAGNLELGEDVQLVSDPHKPICAVVPKTKTAETPGEPGAAAGEGAGAAGAKTKTKAKTEQKQDKT